MIRNVALASIAAIGLFVSAKRPLHADQLAAISLDVVSADPTRQVTFGLRAMGTALKSVAGDSLLRTPYHLNVTDEDFYALVRKESDGDIRVSVRRADGVSGSSALGITMIVASHGQLAVTGFAR